MDLTNRFQILEESVFHLELIPQEKAWIFLFFFISGGESPRDGVASVLDSGLEVSKFELLSGYYVNFQG